MMTEEQSLELFRNVLKDCWDENEKEDALKVAKDVGYLPLALNLAAKRRKGGYSWAKLHKALEEEIARLDVLESPRIFGKGEEGLEASLNLSLKALRSCNEKVWKNLIWLGVLPEDVKINEKMASTLWDADTGEAGDILAGLWGEGLLIQDSPIHLGNEKLVTYRMHDLFHDIALHYLTLSPITKKASDIPGLGLKLSEAHTSLLNRYQSQAQKKGMWHTLVDDAYIHSHLTWHMEKAGQIENIHKLLIEETENGKNGWYETLESLGLNAVFIEDVVRAWSLAEKESKYKVENGGKASSIGLEIRYALIYTSINSLSANIPEEILIALLETKKWTEAKVLTYAQKEPDLYTRVSKLISIYNRINGKYVKKEEVMEKALDAAYKIECNDARAYAFSSIIPYLDGQRKEEMIEKALDAAYSIGYDDGRVWALSGLIPNFAGPRKEEMIEKALDIASKNKYDSSKIEILSVIVPYFEGPNKEKVMEKALDMVSSFEDDDISQVLSVIVPHLDGQKKEELMERAIDIALNIEDNNERLHTLSVVFPKFDGLFDGPRKEEMMEKVLDAVSKIKDDYFQVKTLSVVIPYLDGLKKKEVTGISLDIAYKIESGYSRAKALSILAPFFDVQQKEYLMEKVLDAIHEIEDDSLRLEIFSDIFPYFDGQKKEKLMERALDIASKVQDNYDRVNALATIVPYLNGQRKEELMEKALNIASKIEDDYYIVKALSAIVPNFDGPRKEELMEIALNIFSKIDLNIVSEFEDYDGDIPEFPGLQAFSDLIHFFEPKKRKQWE